MVKKIELSKTDDKITFTCSCGQENTIPITSLSKIKIMSYVAADPGADPPVKERTATYLTNLKQYDCQNPECDATIILEESG